MLRPFRWHCCLASSVFASFPGQFEATARRQTRQGPEMLVGEWHDDLVNPCRAGHGSCLGLESHHTYACAALPHSGGMVVLLQSPAKPSETLAEGNCWRDFH